jgi:hypothetical protein
VDRRMKSVEESIQQLADCMMKVSPWTDHKHHFQLTIL